MILQVTSVESISKMSSIGVRYSLLLNGPRRNAETNTEGTNVKSTLNISQMLPVSQW